MNINTKYVAGYISGIIAGLLLILAILLVINHPKQMEIQGISATRTPLVTAEAVFKLTEPEAPELSTVEIPTKKETPTTAIERVLTTNTSKIEQVSQVETYTPAPVSTPVMETETEAQVDYINTGDNDNDNNINIISDEALEAIRGEMDWVIEPCPGDNLECSHPGNQMETPGADHNQDINAYNL